jgi:phage-related protein
MVDRQNRLVGPSPRPEKTAVKLQSRDELSSNSAGYISFILAGSVRLRGGGVPALREAAARSSWRHRAPESPATAPQAFCRDSAQLGDRDSVA